MNFSAKIGPLRDAVADAVGIRRGILQAHAIDRDELPHRVEVNELIAFDTPKARWENLLAELLRLETVANVRIRTYAGEPFEDVEKEWELQVQVERGFFASKIELARLAAQGESIGILSLFDCVHVHLVSMSISRHWRISGGERKVPRQEREKTLPPTAKAMIALFSSGYRTRKIRGAKR